MIPKTQINEIAHGTLEQIAKTTEYQIDTLISKNASGGEIIAFLDASQDLLTPLATRLTEIYQESGWSRILAGFSR